MCSPVQGLQSCRSVSPLSPMHLNKYSTGAKYQAPAPVEKSTLAAASHIHIFGGPVRDHAIFCIGAVLGARTVLYPGGGGGGRGLPAL